MRKANKLEEDFYTWTGKRNGRLVYTYDEAATTSLKRLTTTMTLSAGRSINTYDADGRQLEWVQYQNGVLRYKRFFKYDREGRVTEQETV